MELNLERKIIIMAITLNSNPANIDQSGAFNVTTSLVEDSAHVNLRIRADIYYEGIIKSTIEKPKGIADFDFANILKSLCPGLLFARDSGDIVKTGTIGANLITSWAVSSGTWDTFTSSANQITSAIEASTDPVFLKTNDITMAVGELYMLYSVDLATSGVNAPAANNSLTEHEWKVLEKNKSVLIMPITSGTRQIIIGAYGGELNFSGTFLLYKITTNRTTIGNPLVPYFTIFKEVYEDAAGVTQTGATSLTNVYRYVPCRGDDNAFTEYVLHDATSLFANKTLSNNVCKFFTVTPLEYLVSFFSEYVEMELFYSKDGGAYTHTTHPICYEGWDVVIINIGELMLTVATSLRIYLNELGAPATISEVMTVYPDTSQIDERVVLEYDGIVGGKEYLAFEGIKDMSFDTERKYITGSGMNKKPLSFKGINKQSLETRFTDINNAAYLKSLLISEDVKKLEPSYATPTEVTITTNSVRISNSEMFTNKLDIEYEY